MKFNYSKLKGRIYEKFNRVSKFNEELKFSNSRVSYILNKSTKGFNPDDIIKISKMLDIRKDEIVDYFFNIEEE